MPTAASAESLNDFAILAGSTITNDGTTTINGSVGLSPGTAITGFGSVDQQTGTIHAADGVALQAKNDLATAYTVLMGRPATETLTGDLGQGRILTKGVYTFAPDTVTVNLTNDLTLSGGPDDVFIIKIPNGLTTGSNSSIVLDGVNAANVFFVVGSSATLGSGSSFAGQILALTSISLDPTAKIDCGAAWARNGAVTLLSNTINICTFAVASGTIGDIVGDDATETETAVADAIDGSGTTLPIGFGVLALLSPTELAAALSELSGEVASGVGPTVTQDMQDFLSETAGEHNGPGTVSLASSDTTSAADDNTVSVMGYSNLRPAPTTAFTAFDKPLVVPEIGRWNVWASVQGRRGEVDGDADAGTHGRSSQGTSLAIGMDYQTALDTSVGLALSAGTSGFSLADGFGTASSTMVQAAIYGRKTFDQAYVTGVLGYSYHDFSTERTLDFAGSDHLIANFGAQAIATRLEAGYQMGAFTPYAAINGQVFMRSGYYETADSGNSTFALAYESVTIATARSEVGAKIDWNSDYDAGILALHAKAAWAHAFGSNTDVAASFVNLPGSQFTSGGATADADSLLLSAAADLSLGNGTALAGALNGDFARNARSYSGSVKLSHQW